LYNKPQGCGTSVALATGPNDEEEEEEDYYRNHHQWPYCVEDAGSHLMTTVKVEQGHEFNSQ